MNESTTYDGTGGVNETGACGSTATRDDMTAAASGCGCPPNIHCGGPCSSSIVDDTRVGDVTVDAGAEPPKAAPLHEFVMVGVKVQFPVKPYPSQKAVMAQILRGLQTEQNCLLESPTGSGKSLALLCSTLAWQQQQKERAQHYNSLLEQGITDPELLSRLTGVKNTSPSPVSASDPVSAPQPLHTALHKAGGPATATAAAHLDGTALDATGGADGGCEAGVDATLQPGGFLRGDEDANDFTAALSQQPLDGLEGFAVYQPPSSGPLLDDEQPPSFPLLSTTAGGQDHPPPRRMKTSKIYFGSRTHKQIAQVVKELKRTAYANVRSVVLGSREHYCIHPIVSTNSNKNDGCQQLRDTKTAESCRYYNGTTRLKNQDPMCTQLGLPGAHDLEELVQAGRRHKCCPYYLARQLKDFADIVFCPYNYLIDPLIRDAMMINLRNSVVVLDEAHNIEDCAREAASCLLVVDDLQDARTDIEHHKEVTGRIDECNALALFLSILISWMIKHASSLADSYESSRNSRIYTGTNMLEILDDLEIGRQQWKEIRACLSELTEERPDEEDPPKLKTGTVMLLKNVFLMYNYLYTRPPEDADDYRVALLKQPVKRPIQQPNQGGWLPRRKRGASHFVWTVCLNFMCLNPGVAFKEVGDTARNVILTSGTLSPMNSFQSELGIPFQIQLEANHVIDRKQVWVGTVTQGPNDIPLQATYQNTESPQFQDELGSLLLAVCRAVPRGVLCFLPSYSLLDKLLARWESTGLWSALGLIKETMVEPRKSDEFERTLQAFYTCIQDTSDPELCSEGVNGAFLLAVCRGKVSEGLDFTDDNARAVVAVGIPFPNFKDTQVMLKREYNNKHCRTRGLMNGSDWYETQAYRALNQALGRCLRHRFDWGALLLVDARYQAMGYGAPGSGPPMNKYIKGLSKWVRNMVVHQPSCRAALVDIGSFAQHMTQNPPVRPDDYASSNQTIAKKTEDSQQPQRTTILLPSAGGSTPRQPVPPSVRPMTSTQREPKTQTIVTIMDDLPDLSQITAPDDASLSTPNSAAPGSTSERPAPGLGFSFVSALHLPRASRTVDQDVDLSSPFAKLRTASPSAGTADGRKRKFNSLSPGKTQLAKRECTVTSSSYKQSQPSSPRIYKFKSEEEIRMLSPEKNSLSSVATDSKSSAVSHPGSAAGGSRDASSPDLFISDHELSLELEVMPQDACSAPFTTHEKENCSNPDEAGARVTSRPVALTDRTFLADCMDSSSDMEDFDLNKSIRRSPKVSRRVSNRARRTKGVVFTEYKEL